MQAALPISVLPPELTVVLKALPPEVPPEILAGIVLPRVPLADAILTQPGEADAGIRKLLDNPLVETIHAHNATRGCFAAKIERS